MSALHKTGIGVLVLMVVFATGYMAGRGHGRVAALRAAVQAYQARGEIDEKIQNMDGADLCIALGGARYECQGMRGEKK